MKKAHAARYQVLMILSDLAALCFAATCPSVQLVLRPGALVFVQKLPTLVCAQYQRIPWTQILD